MSQTHFGFESVEEQEKARRVRGVFDSVASKYDVMNDLMSAGLHRVWKAYTVKVADVREGQSVLDIAGGTGDLAMAFAPQVGASGRVVHTDINAAMLSEGRNLTMMANRLLELHRVLKPMGKLLVLEFSKVAKPLEKAYDWYSFKVLPLLGKWVANDDASYRYLAESIRMHPDQNALKTMMHKGGFGHVDYHNLSGGMVALHVAIKC